MSADPFDAALDQRELVQFPSVLGDDCPVKALGRRDGVYYFIDVNGEVAKRRARDFTVNGVVDLFAGDVAWLCENFGIDRNRRDGKLAWDNNEATQILMRAGRAAGNFDPVADVRGVGAWADGDDLVVHLGNRLLEVRAAGTRGATVAWLKPGKTDSGLVYPTAPPEPRPDDMPASAEAAAELVAHLEGWNWARKGLDPLLAAGWVVLSNVVGATPYRPTLWLIGDIEVGKSGILAAAAAVHGTDAWIWEDITPAAVKDRVGRDARAVMVDELELDPKGDNRRAKEIVELARFAYRQGRGAYARSGADAKAGRLDAMFAFGSVEPPPIQPADASRHLQLHLNPLNVTPEGRAEYERRLAALHENSGALRMRIYHRWRDFATTDAEIRAALARRAISGRAADTYAPALAAWWIFAHDAAIDQAAADTLVDDLAGEIAEELGGQSRAHEQCWSWLWSRQVEYFRSDQRRTIGSIIVEGMAGRPGDVNEVLGRYGMQLVERDLGDGWQRYLFVGLEDVSGLREVFRGSKWEGGGWTVLLRRLDGAQPTKHQVRICGQRCRGTLVPVSRHTDVSDAEAGVSGDVGEVRRPE